MTDTKDTPGTEVATIISQEVMQQFAQMAAGIPETAAEDAYDSILSQIFAATNAHELNAPWDTHKAEQLEGHRLRIETLKRSESDFTEGLGMYLVIQGTDLTSGERFTLTIGSIAVLAQMAKIYYMGGLPCVARVTFATRPTKNGYKPIHLQVDQITVPA